MHPLDNVPATLQWRPTKTITVKTITKPLNALWWFLQFQAKNSWGHAVHQMHKSVSLLYSIQSHSPIMWLILIQNQDKHERKSNLPITRSSRSAHSSKDKAIILISLFYSTFKYHTIAQEWKHSILLSCHPPCKADRCRNVS